VNKKTKSFPVKVPTSASIKVWGEREANDQRWQSAKKEERTKL